MDTSGKHHGHHGHHGHRIHHGRHKKENVWLGALGAFLFSLIGAVIYAILNAVGLIGSLSGFIAVYCAIIGYSILAKRESKRGVVISLVISAIVITLTFYLCFCFNTVEQINEQAGTLPEHFKNKITLGEFIPKSFEVIARQPDLLIPLAVSYVFGALGFFSYSYGLFFSKKEGKKNKDE